MSQAIVTGTSSGIGRAVAEQMMRDGWFVHGIDQHPAVISGAGFKAWQVDLSMASEIDRLLDDLLATIQPKALVHAAGLLRVGSVDELHAADGAAMWHVHVDAAVRLGHRVLPIMRQAGHGRVVFIGSRVASGMPGKSLYAASKSALITLAKSWAAECIHDGVTVNVVSPAATDTAMLHDPARQTSTPRVPPIGRLIQAQEVADLVAFLTRPQSAAITGQDWVICGGASLSS